MKNKSKFEKELKALINQMSLENGSDTPDWILAEYLADCLEAFNRALHCRENYYGRPLRQKTES